MVIRLLLNGYNTYESDGFLTLLQETADYIYTNAGIEEGYLRTKYHISNGKTRARIGGVRPYFNCNSYPEYKRVSMLMNEEPIVLDLINEVNTEDVLFDIGANVGIYSTFVGKRLNEGTVVVFEPEPANMEAAQRHLERNDISYIAKKLALSSQDGSAFLDIERDQVGEGRHQLIDKNTKNAIEIEMVQGDELINSGEIPQPSIVKIDVEGSEVDVLRGLSESLSNSKCRTVYCETHPKILKDRGYSGKDILRLLRQYGYKVEYLSGKRGSRSHLKATKA